MAATANPHLSPISSILQNTPRGKLKYDHGSSAELGRLSPESSYKAIVQEVHDELNESKTKTVFHLLEHRQRKGLGLVDPNETDEEVEENNAQITPKAEETIPRKQQPKRIHTSSSRSHDASPNLADLLLDRYETQRQEELAIAKFRRQANVDKHLQSIQKKCEEDLLHRLEKLKKSPFPLPQETEVNQTISLQSKEAFELASRRALELKERFLAIEQNEKELLLKQEQEAQRAPEPEPEPEPEPPQQPILSIPKFSEVQAQAFTVPETSPKLFHVESFTPSKPQQPPHATSEPTSTEKISFPHSTPQEKPESPAQTTILQWEDQVKAFNNKHLTFLCQRAVVTPINAISGVSSVHLRDKYDRLYNLLSGAEVNVNDDTLKLDHLGIKFCMNLMAKKFVKQGLDEVPSKPQIVFNLGTAITSLWIGFPDFGRLFLAHLEESCPFLHKHVIREDMTEKSIQSMGGCARLLAAVCISPAAKELVDNAHPYGIGHLWGLLAGLLNRPSLTNVTATLLFGILDVAGFHLEKAYGSVFKKLLICLKNQYLPLMEGKDQGPFARLSSHVDDIIQNGCTKPAKYLDQGFY